MGKKISPRTILSKLKDRDITGKTDSISLGSIKSKANLEFCYI